MGSSVSHYHRFLTVVDPQCMIRRDRPPTLLPIDVETMTDIWFEPHWIKPWLVIPLRETLQLQGILQGLALALRLARTPLMQHPTS